MKNREVCPCCQRPIARVRAIAAVPPSASIVDVDAMSDAALKEYRKLTAPGLDVDFLIRARMSAGLRAQLIALRYDSLADGRLKRGVNRADFYRQYGMLRDAWHRESNARERVENIAAAWMAHGDAIALARGVDDDRTIDYAELIGVSDVAA